MVEAIKHGRSMNGIGIEIGAEDTMDAIDMSPLKHPVYLSMPERTVPSAWTQHVPLAMLLVDLARPTLLVELGAYAGTSYCAFCQAVRDLRLGTRCVAIDTWRGDEHGGFFPEDVYDDLRAHHDSRYSTFSTLLRSTFDDAIEQFSDGSIDLLHIDGYHTYEAVRHDFENWLPKMSPQGVILLHDINERQDDFGVWRLWDEVKRTYPSFEVLHGHGLGIVAVGSEIPDGIQSLFSMPRGAATALRELLYALGRRIEAEQRVEALDEHVRFTERQAQARIDDVIAEQQVHIDDVIAEHNAHLKQVERQTMEQVALTELQTQRECEELAAHYEANSDALQRQLADAEERVRTAHGELAWLNTSRGVKAIRLARASRAVLTNKGPVALTRHVGSWLLGKRGYYLRDIPSHLGAAPAQVTEATNRLDARLIVAEHLPPNEEFQGVSIVLLSYNGLDVARACVESLYRVACRVPFEVIVVDNGSQPDLKAWVQQEAARRPSFYYVSLAENLGFPRGMNTGILHARGQYVVLLNNDTLVTPGWLDEMVAVCERDPAIGVVGPMTNYVGHGPQKDPLAAALTPEGADDYALKLATRSPVQYVPDRLVFFAVLIKRQALNVLGGLDEGYGKGNYEDDDYCTRARLAGFKLAIAKRAFVYHNHGSRTWNTSPDLNHTLNMERNKMRFLGKLSSCATTLAPTALRPRSSAEAPEVSVVVRTVNRPETLALALTSLANQTFAPFEVVVVNDGGPDLTALLEPFRRYLTIREIRHETARGRTEALNAGVTASRGAWVTFLDDDDIVYPLHLELFWDTAQSAPRDCAFVYANYMRTLVAGTQQFTTVARQPLDTWEFDRNELLARNHIPIHCWFVRREAALEAGLFDTSMDMLEDWDFLIRLGLRHTFYPTRRLSCEYRFYLNASNSLAWNRQNALEGMRAIFDRYPTTNPRCLAEREIELSGLRRQANEMAQVKAQQEAGKITRDEASRKVVALFAGLRT